MNNVFETYYKILYNNYRNVYVRYFDRDDFLQRFKFGDFRFNHIDAILKAIIDFEYEIRESGVNVRDDAKCLLLLNFDQMVFRPLELKYGREKLIEDIYTDVQSILREAYETVKREEKEEISSHQVLKAGVKVWEKLKTFLQDSW